MVQLGHILLSRFVRVLNAGRIGYEKAFKLQKHFESQLINNPKSADHILLIVEHDPVYTLGLRERKTMTDDEERISKLKKDTKAQIIYSDRGGLTTFHGPGQLVIYPIINLSSFGQLTLRKYVSTLETIAVHTCRLFGVNAYVGKNDVSHTGAWANDKKICAIGVHCKRYVTTHGLALNCNVNLEWFEHIVPCGIQDKGVTSLSTETNEDISIEMVIPQFLTCFETNLGCVLENYDEFPIESLVSKL